MILVMFNTGSNMGVVQHACTHLVELPEGLVQTVNGIEEGVSKMSLPKAWNFTFELAAPTMKLERIQTEVTSIVFDFHSDAAVKYSCTAASGISPVVSTPRAVTEDLLRDPFVRIQGVLLSLIWKFAP